MKITWLGHSSFKIQIDNFFVYIDPYLDPFSTEKYEKADMILVSHWHYSHCTVESVKRIRKDETVIFGTREASSQMESCQTVYAGQKFDITDQIRLEIIKAVSSKRNHKDTDMIGFILKLDGKTIYYASDTEFNSGVPLNPTIAIVPVGGSTTMTAIEAARFVDIIKPVTAIPCHYGKLEGTVDDAIEFKKIVEKTDTKVLILTQFKETEV